MMAAECPAGPIRDRIDLVGYGSTLIDPADTKTRHSFFDEYLVILCFGSRGWRFVANEK